MIRFLDKFYSVGEVALALGVSAGWVRDRLPCNGHGPRVLWRDGSVYWPNATDIGGGDVRIPAGDLNGRLAEGLLVGRVGVIDGDVARSRGELLRKVRAKRGVMEGAAV